MIWSKDLSLFVREMAFIVLAKSYSNLAKLYAFEKPQLVHAQ